MAFTFFFRDVQTLEYVSEHVIPELKGRSYIHIWDAGCAMGPEPYTLAILLREKIGRFLYRNVRIHATDIDEQDSFGRTIDRAVYPMEMLKRIPKPLFDTYFDAIASEADSFQLNQEIRHAVTFEKHNLLSLKPIRNNLNMILCKNVLLHFNPAQRIEVYTLFHRALAQDGFLVTEHTQKLPHEVGDLFDQIVPNAQIFRKRAV